MLNNIVDNIEQCGQHNIVQGCFHQPRTGCAFFAVYDRKNTLLSLICCHSCAFAFTEQNIKARLNRYIIILEGSVQYFAFHSQQRKNTYSYFTILLCGFYSVTLFVPNIVPFCST